MNHPARWVPAGTGWTVELLDDRGRGGAALAINEAGLIVGSVHSLGGSGLPRAAFWNAGGLFELLESQDGVAEAVGVSESNLELVIGGYVRTRKNGGPRIATRWGP